MVDAVMIGAGLRGMVAYGLHAEAAGVRFVGVVEPVASRREAFGDQHGIDPAHRYASVEAWARGPRLADAAIVATPDDQHVEPARVALETGHDVLVEKPLAQRPSECLELIEVAERVGRRLHVCHVLRYTPFFRAVRQAVASGRLGRVVSVSHRENVDARHFAHSYVRGAYRRTEASNPLLLAKCSHDLDLLAWILDDPVVRVSSFGSLSHFRSDRVGPEIPARCTDGCPVEADCAFSAIGAYAPAEPVAGPEIAVLTQLFALTDPPSFERGHRLAALRTSPYGRCVYRCDNDVVDHQVVAMELASGATVSFSVHGHSHREGRTIRIDGTRATLRAAFTDEPEITIHPHGGGAPEALALERASAYGHGGGDLGTLRAFAASITPGAHAAGEGLTTDARTSMASHLVGWAAEEARATGTVVDVAAFARAALDQGGAGDRSRATRGSSPPR